MLLRAQISFLSVSAQTQAISKRMGGMTTPVAVIKDASALGSIGQIRQHELHFDLLDSPHRETRYSHPCLFFLPAAFDKNKFSERI